MKKVFFMLLCAASVALVGCKKDNQESEEPKTPKYSVADEVDINVMKTIATQFTTDTAKMAGVIKGLGFTYVVKENNEKFMYYRSAAESKDDKYPVICMKSRTSGYTQQVAYSSYTSFNVVGNKSQIVPQLGETVVVYGRNCLFAGIRVDSGEWNFSIQDGMSKVASAHEVLAVWSMSDGTEVINLTILYEKEQDVTSITYSCDAPDMIK